MSWSRALVCASAVVVLSACGSGDGEPDASPSESESVALMIRLVTESGTVAANFDDTYCVWSGTSYTLRDGAGEIVATGDAVSDVPGEAEAGGEAGVLGEVRSTDPYECVLPFTISDVPRGDFFELEVSTVGPRSQDVEFGAEATFGASEAASDYLEVEVRR